MDDKDGKLPELYCNLSDEDSECHVYKLGSLKDSRFRLDKMSELLNTGKANTEFAKERMRIFLQKHIEKRLEDFEPYLIDQMRNFFMAHPGCLERPKDQEFVLSQVKKMMDNLYKYARKKDKDER